MTLVSLKLFGAVRRLGLGLSLSVHEKEHGSETENCDEHCYDYAGLCADGEGLGGGLP